MVLEVNGGRLTDLLVHRGFGDKAENSKRVVRAVGGFAKGLFSIAARLRGWRKSMEKTLREAL